MLSAAEVEHFHEQGWLPPFELMPRDSMAALRTELEQIFDTTENSGHNSHQREAAVWELASHEAIVGRMASLLGPDLSIWRTNFFVKEGVDSDSPLQREIPFHQDANYWPLEPAVILSAWIAVTDSTPEMGCLQVIPRSHRTVVPHVHLGRDHELPSNFVSAADPAAYDPGQKRHFWRHLYIKCIILPSQARDKHRENSKKDGVSHSRRGGRSDESWPGGCWSIHATHPYMMLVASPSHLCHHHTCHRTNYLN
jgi:hypothetical protein